MKLKTKLINRLNTQDTTKNDILVYEASNFQNLGDVRRFFEDLKKECKIKAGIIIIPKGTFLNLKTEKEMNKLGWYKASKENKLGTLLK